MGFPTRTTSEVPCLVHATRLKTLLARTAFTCPQCQANNSELPTDCAVCGLKLVLAPHLARSFHHLFPVAPFCERSVIVGQQAEASPAGEGAIATRPKATMDTNLLVSSEDDDGTCYACLKPLGMPSGTTEEELLRFECPDCKNLFCVDCDAFLHETLHNCPGCLCRF
jgi:transcription initiation factor TFIIH subunit 2